MASSDTSGKWFNIIRNEGKLSQGDIILGCLIPQFTAQTYDSIVSDNDEIENPVDIIQQDVIVLSQSCDLENAKIKEVILCPIWPLRKLMAKSEYY